jgi:hypothetical protein
MGLYGTNTGSPLSQAILNADKANNVSLTPEFASGMGLSSLNPNYTTPAQTTYTQPAAPIQPAYTKYSNSDIANYLAANSIDVGNANQVAAAVKATNADPGAVSNFIANNYTSNMEGLAGGGFMDTHYRHGGDAHMQPRYLQGPTDGMADDVPSSIDGIQPAKLSHGEFVIPADVVSHLGNGNSDAGANKLYQMMDKIRMARTGTKKQGKEINPDKFTLGGKTYNTGGQVAFSNGGVPGFATGSAVDLTSTPLGYSNITELSPYIGDYVSNMLGKTQALANAPMPVYQGELAAGPSNLQQQQFAGLSALSQTGLPPVQFSNTYQAPKNYQPLQASTQNFTNAGISEMPDLSVPNQSSLVNQSISGRPFSQAVGESAVPINYTNQSTAAQYMSPYLQQSLQPQLNQLAYTAAQDQQGMLGNLTKQGAYGGSRQAVAQGVAQGNLLNNQANLIGQGYNTAYSNAMNQFNADQARQLQAQQANIGQQQYGYTQNMNAAQNAANYAAQAQQNQQAANQQSAQFGLSTLGALGTAGGVQQGLTQAQDTASLNQFNQQQQYPYAQLQFEQSMLQNLPISTQTIIPNTTSLGQTTKTISDLSQLYSLLNPSSTSAGVTK